MRKPVRDAIQLIKTYKEMHIKGHDPKWHPNSFTVQIGMIHFWMTQEEITLLLTEINPPREVEL